MFSGIIESIGTVVMVSPRGNGRTLVIRSDLPVAPAGEAGVGRPDRERVGLGDSIACNGVCLTVEAVAPPDRFTVAAGAETIARTTAGSLRVGDTVHLERALRLGDRMDTSWPGTWMVSGWFTASSGPVRAWSSTWTLHQTLSLIHI